jgi:hypothetical protein
MQAGIILEEQGLRRSFLKTSISVDTDKKVILVWKISQKTDYEIKSAKCYDKTIK